MNTTPLWVPLVVAALGVAGVLFTQWRSDVREQNRSAAEERREEHRLARDAEREREARLFEHRSAVFAKVSQEYHRWWSVAYDVEHGISPTPPEDAMEDFWRIVGEVDLYGGQEVAERAVRLHHTLSDWVFGPRSSEDPGFDATYRYESFLAAARAELGVPPRQLPAGPERSWEA